jgi:predicted amidohydrolase
MKVTLIQTQLFWEDRQKNLSHFDRLVSSIKEQTDLIVLPEMFTTGFSMNPEKVAEEAQGEGLAWLKQKAKEKNAVITGSMAVKEDGKYYNRLFWVEASGAFKTYDKRHLFRMAKEDTHYTAGKKKIIGEINEWKVCPFVCYDLRFPVWSRNRFQEADDTDAERSRSGSGQEAVGSWDYDVLMYVANWPEVRSYPWKQLLIARAIENQCYVVGVNRIGNDGNGFGHSGDSVVLNPRGEVISMTKANEESIETVELDRNYLDVFRKNFPVGLDADDFKV